jgi:hypothetical protein
MIYHQLDQNTVDEHYTKLEPYLTIKLNESSLNNGMKAFIKKNLKSIITETPIELRKLNSKFKKLNSWSDTKIVNGKVNKILNYSYFSKKETTPYNAYSLAKKLNIRTCLYCNRNYTITVSKIGSSSTTGYTRPQFDHFYDKAKHPLLALSVYNLIPCCSTCNSTLKGSEKFNLNKNIHPYIDNVEDVYSYEYLPHTVSAILGSTSELSVKINNKATNPVTKIKIDNSVDTFKLNEIMSSHSEELKDLFLTRHRCSLRYLIELQKTYAGTHLNKEDVYRIVFGVYYDPSDYSKRPFSKLKKDILEELGILLELQE